ncbi:MAG: hypothetical protein V1782_09235 [Pseudomonadota bacterium]
MADEMGKKGLRPGRNAGQKGMISGGRPPAKVVVSPTLVVFSPADTVYFLPCRRLSQAPWIIALLIKKNLLFWHWEDKAECESILGWFATWAISPQINR